MYYLFFNVALLLLQAALLFAPACHEAIWQGCLHVALSIAGVALASRKETIRKPVCQDSEVQTDVEAT
jgi:hypothetical protein